MYIIFDNPILDTLMFFAAFFAVVFLLFGLYFLAGIARALWEAGKKRLSRL